METRIPFTFSLNSYDIILKISKFKSDGNRTSQLYPIWIPVEMPIPYEIIYKFIFQFAIISWISIEMRNRNWILFPCQAGLLNRTLQTCRSAREVRDFFNAAPRKSLSGTGENTKRAKERWETAHSLLASTPRARQRTKHWSLPKRELPWKTSCVSVQCSVQHEVSVSSLTLLHL